MEIKSLESTLAAVGTQGATLSKSVAPRDGFQKALAKALADVNTQQKQSEHLAREFQLENPNVSLEETVLAAQKANISFQALVQVRNRLVTAYHDIMSMPV